MLVVVVGLGVALLIYRSANGPERWSGWVYPEGVQSNPQTWRSGGPFDSAEKCRRWARAELDLIFRGDVPHGADYECGLNCKPSGMINICEQTVD